MLLFSAHRLGTELEHRNCLKLFIFGFIWASWWLACWIPSITKQFTSLRIFQLYTLAAGVFEFLMDKMRGVLSVIFLFSPRMSSNFPIKYPDKSSSSTLDSSPKLPFGLYRWLLGNTSIPLSHLYSSWDNYALFVIFCSLCYIKLHLEQIFIYKIRLCQTLLLMKLWSGIILSVLWEIENDWEYLFVEKVWFLFITGWSNFIVFSLMFFIFIGFYNLFLWEICLFSEFYAAFTLCLILG